MSHIKILKLLSCVTENACKMNYEIFEERINELDEAVWEEIADVRKLVRKIVPGYKY